MLAKVAHDNLNAGGGSESLAIASIQALEELGFEVDVETCIPIVLNDLKKFFGDLELRIRKLKKLDLHSFLEDQHERNNNDYDEYDLVINTHGDLLPYLPQGYGRGINQSLGVNKHRTLAITYCHYPLACRQL